MTDKLPPMLLQLFAPRPPLRWLEPIDFAPEKRQSANIGGIGQYMQALRDYKDNDGYVPSDSWLQKRDRKILERKARQEQLPNEAATKYKPKEDPKIVGDAYKTLFVSRLSYEVTEDDLEREFGRYGPIERIRIVEDVDADPDAPLKKRKRGYAFIVYEREKDMKAAYKDTNGISIKGRKVFVDVERGRTVAGWRPRRFGGGLGGRHYTKEGARAGPSAGYGPPAGPGGFGNRGGGFGGRAGGFGGRGGFGGGGGRYGEDRYGSSRGSSGANNEPLGSRDRARDRDRDSGYGGRDDSGSRKRGYEGDSYDDPRQRRRY
ncbi:RNA-binding domain-containing protein [Byssothecium circinans]|uniref:RNA-binding domain-containing protein n=1 Tax=Byssothecium circinans TaxID=147558 RepID=A0A6A5TYP1_9PLEO|nr:RNA-binding domain-containing protein [Byssothecium circinans]